MASSDPAAQPRVRGGDGRTERMPSRAERLARWLARRKNHSREVPPEAAELAAASDATVTYSDGMSLVITCILDAERDPNRHLVLGQAKLVAIGRALLRYTAKVSGSRLPATIRVVEIRGSSAPEHRERLRALHRSLPGRKKVAIFCFELDPTSRRAWSPGWLNGLLRGRRLYDKAMQQWDDPSLLGSDGAGPHAGGAPPSGDAAAGGFVPPAARSLRNPLAAIGDHKPVATGVLLAVLALCFAAELAFNLHPAGEGSSWSPSVATLQGMGGLYRPAVLQQNEWWRLLTAPMLHAGVLHLVFNAVALLLGGIVLEGVAGRAWMLGLFFVGGLGGSLASLLINPDNLVSVGASGAIMALLAAAACVAQRLPPGERMAARLQLLRILIPSLLPLASVHSGERIDYAAHVGGAIVGTAVGLLLVWLWPRAARRPPAVRLMSAVAAAGVLVVLASAPLAAKSYAGLEQQLTLERLLVPNDELPSGGDQGWLRAMAAKAPDWQRRYGRDPRVHVAAAMYDEQHGDLDGAERELRAALDEPKLLALLLPPGAFAEAVRSDLAALVADRGRRDEARALAAPLCTAAGEPATRMTELGLCGPSP